jgi:hypothetical protein
MVGLLSDGKKEPDLDSNDCDTDFEIPEKPLFATGGVCLI